MRLLSISLIIVLIGNCGNLWGFSIVDYRQRADGLAERVHAIIRFKDLRTGQPTSINQTLAAQIRALGKPGDDCGHIVANVLGGPLRPYNLFPQNGRVNSGQFRIDVEAHMQYFLEDGENEPRIVDYQARLIYVTPLATRPIMLTFFIRFLNGSLLVPTTEIPVSGEHRVTSNPYMGVIQNPVIQNPDES